MERSGRKCLCVCRESFSAFVSQYPPYFEEEKMGLSLSLYLYFSKKCQTPLKVLRVFYFLKKMCILGCYGIVVLLEVQVKYSPFDTTT